MRSADPEAVAFRVVINACMLLTLENHAGRADVARGTQMCPEPTEHLQRHGFLSWKNASLCQEVLFTF